MDGGSTLQLALRQMANEGTFAGAMAGLLASLEQRNGIQRRQSNRKIEDVQTEIDQLEAVVSRLPVGPLSKLGIRQIADLIAGMAQMTVQIVSGGIYLNPTRPQRINPAEAAAFTFPPYPSTLDAKGNVVTTGQMWKFGQVLALPEVHAAICGMQLDAGPSGAQLQQILAAWSAFQFAMSQTGVIPLLTAAQLAAQVPQIGSSPLSQASLSNLFQTFLSQASQAFHLALAGVGPLTSAQVQTLVTAFTSWVNAFLGTGSSSGTKFGELVDIITADSDNIANTTTETAFSKSLTIPANKLAVGRSLRIRFGVRYPTTNSTDTGQIKVRMDSASGTTLHTSTAVDVADADTGFVDLTITRRDDAGSTVVEGFSVNKTSAKADQLTATTIDWKAERKIVATMTWSVASASDIAVLATGTAELA